MDPSLVILKPNCCNLNTLQFLYVFLHQTFILLMQSHCSIIMRAMFSILMDSNLKTQCGMSQKFQMKSALIGSSRILFFCASISISACLYMLCNFFFLSNSFVSIPGWGLHLFSVCLLSFTQTFFLNFPVECCSENIYNGG